MTSDELTTTLSTVIGDHSRMAKTSGRSITFRAFPRYIDLVHSWYCTREKKLGSLQYERSRTTSININQGMVDQDKATAIIKLAKTIVAKIDKDI